MFGYYTGQISNMMMVILWSLDAVPSNRVSPFAIYRPEVSVFYLLMFYAKTVFIRWCHQTEDIIQQGKIYGKI